MDGGDFFTRSDSRLMTRVLLIRHGETLWNRERRWQGHADIPLSREGERQAEELARYLQQGFDSVPHLYSSDLARAADTARRIGSALGVHPVLDPAWREMDVGSWSGLSRDEIMQSFPEEWERMAAGEDLPRGGGETFAGFTRRVVTALARLPEIHRGDNVAVVTHGGVIRATLLYVLGLPYSRLREMARFDNTAFAELHRGNEGWTVARSGVTPCREASAVA